MYKIGESFKLFDDIKSNNKDDWEEHESENWLIQKKQKELDNLKKKITQRKATGVSFFSADELEFLKLKYNKKFVVLEELKLMEFCKLRRDLALKDDKHDYIKILKDELQGFRLELIKYIVKKKRLEKNRKTVDFNILSKITYYKNKFKESEDKLKEYLLEHEEIEIEKELK